MNDLRHMHLLLVEDNPGDAKLVQMALAAETLVEFEVVHKDTLAGAKEHLAKGGVDVILLDLSLPDSFGMNTVRAVMETAPAVPIIVLTGLDDAEVGYNSVKEGAQDYLVKGHADGDQLRRSILYAQYRKSAQLTIERLHQRNDHILSAMGEGLIGVDLSGRTIFLNPEFLRMTGLSRQDVMGKLPQDILQEVDIGGQPIAFSGSPIAQTLADGQVRHVSDVYITRRDGALVPVDYIVTPMLDGDEIEGAVAAYRDVSDRQGAFDVLQRQLGFHQKMIDALTVPLFYLDPEGMVLGCNAVFSRLAGKPSLAMLGYSAGEVLPAEIARQFEEAFETLRDGSCVNGQVVLDREYHLTLSSLIADNGALLGFLGELKRA